MRSIYLELKVNLPTPPFQGFLQLDREPRALRPGLSCRTPSGSFASRQKPGGSLLEIGPERLLRDAEHPLRIRPDQSGASKAVAYRDDDGGAKRQREAAAQYELWQWSSRLPGAFQAHARQPEGNQHSKTS